MTMHTRPTPKQAKSISKREKIGKTPLDPTRPIGKGNPPVETQIKPGQVLNPHGRPRTIGELRDLIQAIGAEGVSGVALTRIELKVRQLYASKHPKDAEHLLKYGWGAVPQPTHEMSNDEWRDWFLMHGYTESDANRAFESMVKAAAHAVESDAAAPASADGERGDASSGTPDGDSSGTGGDESA